MLHRIAIGCCSAIIGMMAVREVARAQAPASSPVTFSAKTIQGDFAVPEVPAVMMVNGDQSKLLRPSSVQQLVSNLTTASKDFSLIPKTFGAEFSPAMLTRGDNLSIAEYQAHRMLYRTRLSFAAKRDSGTRRSQVAMGLRVSLDDESDLRTNAASLKAFDDLTSIKVDSMRALRLALFANRIPVREHYSAAEQRVVDSIGKAVADSLREILGDRPARALAAVKRAREAVLWNAEVADIALGLRASSADSLGKKSRFDGIAGWFTKGWRVSAVSQLLIGLRGAYERDSTGSNLQSAGDAVGRYYLGSNAAKISFEASATGRASTLPKWGLRLGGEFEAAKTIWIELGAGWQANGAFNHGGFTHSLKFQLAPPNT